jgi:hypothetical protein
LKQTCDLTEEELAAIAARRERQRAQAEHDESIRKQRMKLKIAPWRSDPSRPDFVSA